MRRSEGRGPFRGREQVLHGDRHAVQRPAQRSVADLPRHFGGLAPRRLGEDANEGFDRAVVTLDARERFVDQRFRGDEPVLTRAAASESPSAAGNDRALPSPWSAPPLVKARSRGTGCRPRRRFIDRRRVRATGERPA